MLLLFGFVYTFGKGYTLKPSSLPQKPPEIKDQQISADSNKNQETLGSSRYRAPQIYISGGNNGYSSGGMIALASTDEPAVQIGGYNISGQAEIDLYETNDDALLDYLAHDKEGKQIKKTPDKNKIRYITTIKEDIKTKDYEGSKVTLPLSERGIWYLKITISGITTDAFVIRSSIGAIAKEGNDEYVFWGQNFKTKRSVVNEGMVILYSLQDGRKELERVQFNSDGIAKAKLNPDADIALIAQNEERSVIPINLKYLNTSYTFKTFYEKTKSTRYFIFTDRPLYKPGDTIYFKAVLRDDDDARYTVPTGDAVARIYNGSYYEGSDIKPLYEKSYSISADGTISGEYKLPQDAKTGYYSLYVVLPDRMGRTSYWDQDYSSNSIYFNVEHFKKPEFSIEVSIPKTELIAGDDTSFKITGQYFSGQPLSGQKVKYTVYSADFYEYSYLRDYENYSQTISNDYRYGYWYGNNKVTDGTATLNTQGEAEIDLDTKSKLKNGKTQVFSIEATIEDGSQTPSFSRKNMLVFAGEYGIYRKDYSYGGKVNTNLSLPVSIMPYRNGKISNVDLTAKVHREDWVSYQEENKKYLSYKKIDEDLSKLTAKTDEKGNAVFNFVPTKTGSYTITVEGKDSRDNAISKVFYSYVTSEDQPDYNPGGANDITISSDKQKYLPKDSFRLKIFSQVPNRDVFLSLERGRMDRFQIVHLNGKTGTVDVSIVGTDIPNIYAKVSSFSNFSLDTNTTNLVVSSESKKIVVNITPDSKTFGPSDTINVNLQTTDVGGNPVSAELAFWAVDKAIFEISDNKLGDIFKTFWHERADSTQEAHSLEGIMVMRAEGGGCLAEGAQVLMKDGKLKNIEDVKTGDYVLTRAEKDSKLVSAKVLKTHFATVAGYLILNGNLKITANHKLRVNNIWTEAGSIKIGDVLTNIDGQTVKINSIEWINGKFKVYNLEIEKYHSYFADNIWVHNDKGMERNTFKDTAYWNPSIKTDETGRAKVSFKLPDNLTTWTLAAVAASLDTSVGQTTNEIVVTKDVIVRPVLPNILRVGDKIVLSALVQNFTEKDEKFNVDLKFDSGDVKQATKKNVLIKSKEMQQIFWTVYPKQDKEKAKLTFSAQSTEDKKVVDTIVQEIPIRPFGFMEQRAETGNGPKDFSIKLAQDINKQKSNVTLSLAPTILGSLPSAMEYLIGYPYGCVEQTTSRFVPAVIAKANSDLFKDAMSGKNVDDMIKKGLSRLSTLQKGDGGWTWWYSGNSDYFITAYVVEYILMARDAGIEVDKDMLKRAQDFLEIQDAGTTKEDIIAKTYALTLLNSKNRKTQLSDLGNLSPDILAMAVMTNYKNGDTNPQTNGLSLLESMAKTQGDGVFWSEGAKENFASHDASTAFAIRAIVTAGGNRELAVKGARYLIRNRKSQYWSNTFATAQVIRAVVDLVKTESEVNPNYNYSVKLDGREIAKGSITDSKQTKDVKIPVDSIKQSGSKISVSKNGEGQIYSTLVIKEFHTDKGAKAKNNGLTVKREYVNEKGSGYSLAVGDTVTVNIRVGGLGTNESYGIIEDQLPSGMIPINESFKNEQYGQNNNSSNFFYGVSDREYTENGAILSLYHIFSGESTYSYKARVINEGTFIVPPATASLMYSPEIYGRSDVQTIKTTKQSEASNVEPPQEPASDIKIKDTSVKTNLLTLVSLLAALTILVVIFRFRSVIGHIRDRFQKSKSENQNNSQPDDTNPPPQSG